jgi:hypothetical protein
VVGDPTTADVILDRVIHTAATIAPSRTSKRSVLDFFNSASPK